MARQKAEKPKDLRLPTEFPAGVNLWTKLNDCQQRYRLAVAPPDGMIEDDPQGGMPEWNGRVLDSLFGIRRLCDVAEHLWRARTEAARAARVDDPEMARLGTGAIHVVPATWSSHVLRIPRSGESRALLIGTSFGSFYPTEQAYMPDETAHDPWTVSRHLPSMRHADIHGSSMTVEGIEMVEQMRAWAMEVLAAAARAARAIDVMSQAFNCAYHTKQVFDTLPGSADALVAMGVDAAEIRLAQEPLRGVKPFLMDVFRARVPDWAESWSRHRAVLLALGVARSSRWRLYSGTRVAYHVTNREYSTDR